MSQRSGRHDHEGWLWQNVGNYGYDQGKLDAVQQAARMSRSIGETLSYAHLVLTAGYYEALFAFLRGYLAEAEAILDAPERWTHEKYEVQVRPFLYLLRAEIAMARGQVEDAIGALRLGMERIGGEFMLGMADELLAHLVRALVLVGRPSETDVPLGHLRTVAKGRPNSEAFLAWAEGLVTPDPAEGAERLRSAVDKFHRLGRRIDEARCLKDLAGLVRASGADGSAEEARAGELLTECGADVFLSSPAVAS